MLTSYIECYTSNLAEFFNSLAVVLFERGKSLNQTNAGAFVYSRLGMTVLRFNEGQRWPIVVCMGGTRSKGGRYPFRSNVLDSGEDPQVQGSAYQSA